MGEPTRRRSRAEVSFHVGLLAILLPVVTVPLLWGLAVHNAIHQREDGEQRRWSRRLFALALIDTLVAVSIVVASATGMQQALTEPREPPRIGVLLEAEDGGEEGVPVRDVLPGSPAAEAGVQPGDRIVAVGGSPVATRAEVLERLRADEPVTVAVERAGETIPLEVRPTRELAPPPVVRSTERCEAPSSTAGESPWRLAPYGLALFVILVLWGVGRARGVRQWTFWLPFGAVFVSASVAGAAGQRLGCVAFGGSGLRATATSLLVAEVVLTAVAVGWFLVARRRGQPELRDERERWATGRTYGVGLLYAMAWLPRVAALSIPLLWAAQQLGVLEVSPMLEDVLGGAGTDVVSAAFVAVSAVVLAPIAEEVLFRGLLMPHLGRALSAWPVVYTSAAVFGLLHVSHGVMLLGPLVLGAIMGWARLRSGGLATPILLHVSFNAVAVLSSWL